MKNLNVIEKTEERHRQRIAEHFSSNTKYWDAVYDEKNPASGRSLIQQENMNYRKQITLSYISAFAGDKSLEILDVGCGTGSLMASMLAMGHRVRGVDISERMVETVNSRLKTEGSGPLCLKAAVEVLPFATNTFDIITCLGVIEYLYKPEKGIEEIFRVLKDDGLFIVSAPNLIKLQFILDPYYYFNRSVKYFFVKSGINKWRQTKAAKEISTNRNFTNKRYTYSGIISLLSGCNLYLSEFENIGFGPVTFWQKNIFSDSVLLKTNNTLIRLSHKKFFGFLKFFANRWVFCLKKK